eukprot:SAG31_NODE_5216_length_2670_cov_1.605212_1_plen_115_part_00
MIDMTQIFLNRKRGSCPDKPVAIGDRGSSKFDHVYRGKFSYSSDARARRVQISSPRRSLISVMHSVLRLGHLDQAVVGGSPPIQASMRPPPRRRVRIVVPRLVVIVDSSQQACN